MNKNILYAILLVVAASLTVISCKKNNLFIDKEVVAPSFVKFNRLINTDTVTTYYINAANAPMKLAIGVTSLSSVARTIQLTYTSRTAVQGVQYNAPATLVIPAGKSLDSLTFTGLFAGYTSATRLDTVDITITGGDIPTSAYNGKHRLILRKYCNVSLPALLGAYANTKEYNSAGAEQWGPYTTTVKNLIQTGPTTATGQITNMYDFGWNDINVVFDWTNPAAFKVTIPSQPTGIGSPSIVRTSTAAGTISTFSSCDNTITLDTDLLTGTTVNSSKYRFSLIR